MADPFTFKLPNGQTVRTGTIVPEQFPLSFVEYPEDQLLSIDQVKEILANPRRKRKREFWDRGWIMNQGRRGSCNAYMAAGMMRRIRFLHGLDDTEFQPEFIYMHINGGRDVGSMLDDGMRFITDSGCCEKGLVPYEAYKISQVPRQQYERAKENAKRFRVFECYQLPRDSVERLWAAAISAVCRGYQVGVAVHVGNSYLRTSSDPDAVYGFDRGPGNHAVGCDDAYTPGNPRDFTDILLEQYGSWGPGHAYNGRAYLTPRHLEEPSRYHAMYAIRSTTHDPEAESPTIRK